MAKGSLRLIVSILGVGATLAIVAGPALADGGRGASKQSLIQAAATYLGVNKAEIRDAREEGTSLAQLAVADGKTVQGLSNALVAAGTKRINQARAAGKITSAQAAAKIAALPAQVNRLINATGEGGGSDEGGGCPH